MVGLAGLELVRTLRGSDNIVRMLRIVLALLRHVRTMGCFFTHYSFEAVARVLHRINLLALREAHGCMR